MSYFHSAPPDPLTGFEGVLLVREGKGIGEKGRGKKGEGEEMEERGMEERGKIASWLLGEWTPLISCAKSSSASV